MGVGEGKGSVGRSRCTPWLWGEREEEERPPVGGREELGCWSWLGLAQLVLGLINYILCACVQGV